MSELTPKQERFVTEYLVDLNATQAAVRAGYSAKTAHAIGPKLTTKPSIQAAIETAKAERSTRVHITQDRVLQELARIAFADPRKFYRDDGSMKQPHELDEDTAATLASVDVVEITAPGEVPGADLVDEIKPPP